MMKKNNNQTTIREKGQVLVVVALTIMVLIGVIGLAVDSGYVYVSYSRLRRAVDAAALAATGEFKRNYKDIELVGSAQQQLKLNDVVMASDSSNPDVSIVIQTCSTAPADPVLCPKAGEIAKKLVRIKVTQDVPMFFMSVWGWKRVPITVETIAQAASLDVVLLIQNSESMTFAANDNANKDPHACNPGNACQPFKDVKAAASAFVDNLMYFPYDRVAIVTFNQVANLDLELTDESGGPTVQAALNGLKVYDPAQCVYKYEDRLAFTNPVPAPVPGYTGDPMSPCRLYKTDGTYMGYLDCPMFYATDLSGNRTSDNDPSWCGTTNPAAGLAMAGNHLQGAYPTGWTGTVRDDAVWVILLLGTGAPTSAQDDHSKPLCPKSTVNPAPNYTDYTHPGCRDTNVLIRHCYKSTDTTCLNASYDAAETGIPANFMVSTYDPTHYDAYDRTFDMVDTEVSNSIYIFTIGLGLQVKSTTANGETSGFAPGETFLKYAAKVGGGIYRYAPDGSGLRAIFLEIANKIATKLTQ